MTMRVVTILGFALLGGVAVMLYLAGRTRRLGLVPLGDLVDALRSRAVVRLVLVMVWGWVGWHVLAR
ncbi:MAG TPA: DUF6186 family protein [Nocardioidaceae bacterium]|nr:DUF6186 family protein [Nocardioidaceae bacterium]